MDKDDFCILMFLVVPWFAGVYTVIDAFVNIIELLTLLILEAVR